MTHHTPVPPSIVGRVEDFIDRQVADVKKFENREHMDSSAIYELHRLAASIYAEGYDDGTRAQIERDRRQHVRSLP